MVVLIFLSAFGTLAISFWPYMIPYVMTVEEAAVPHSSLAFMFFWGEGLFVYPLMLIYTVISIGYSGARYVRHRCTEALPTVRLKSNLGS
jgi:hypothetical protein